MDAVVFVDNTFVERLWRSVKSEHLYLYGHQTSAELADGLDLFVEFYNTARSHQSLDYKTPAEVHYAA